AGAGVERIVGIDLGTTNSLIAVLEDDGPRVIADARTGRKIVPSVVSFPDSGGDAVVGDDARALAVTSPSTTIESAKRFMGLGREHVSDVDRRRYAFAEGPGVVRFQVGERVLTAPEISAYVLRELKRRGEEALRAPV